METGSRSPGDRRELRAELVEGVRTSDRDASRSPLRRRPRGWTRNTMERLCVSSGIRPGSQEELGNAAGGTDIWAPSFNLLPRRPTTGKKQRMDGWMIER